MSSDRSQFDDKQPPDANNSPGDTPGDPNAQRPKTIKPLRPRPAQPDQSAPTPPSGSRPVIKKLPGKGAAQPPQQGGTPDISSASSFEEWERAQNAPEPEPEPELP